MLVIIPWCGLLGRKLAGKFSIQLTEEITIAGNLKVVWHLICAVGNVLVPVLSGGSNAITRMKNLSRHKTGTPNLSNKKGN